jgi:[ribosomal protein S5]-alanine N-acetyltransferase
LTKNRAHRIVIETGRCFLREIVPDDAETAYRLNLDPEVIRYTGDPPFASIEDARRFLENYDHYKRYGFGRWAVIEKKSGDFLGWCGLKFTGDKNEHDIGFRFFKKYWNMGYATETARACVAHGLTHLRFPFIVGRAMRDNAASIKVLKKIGLTFWKEESCGGEEGVVYRIERPA